MVKWYQKSGWKRFGIELGATGLVIGSAYGYGKYQKSKIENLYIRPNRNKPSLAFLHKSAVNIIPEMHWFKDNIKTDADLRSICSVGFAKAFFLYNQ